MNSALPGATFFVSASEVDGAAVERRVSAL
jgi:hypothetical protein